jgi:hypothetical protein
MHVRLKRDHKTIEKNAITEEIEVLMEQDLEMKLGRMMNVNLVALARVPEMIVAHLLQGVEPEEEVAEEVEVAGEVPEMENENSNENLATTERRF